MLCTSMGGGRAFDGHNQLQVEKPVSEMRRAARKHHTAQDKTGIALEGRGFEEDIRNVQKYGAKSFAFSVPVAAPVATLPNRVSAPGDHLNPLENKDFSGELEDAQAECFGVFSPNPWILSKA